MAKRYNLTQTEACREKIKTTQLINRLHGHAFGDIELSQSQVRSIEILLNKTLPNLSAQELTGDVTNYVARLPEVCETAEQWKNSLPEAHRSPQTAESPEGTDKATKH